MVIIMVGLYFWRTKTGDELKNIHGKVRKETRSLHSGCISEGYHFPIRQDLPLYGYLPVLSSFTGRKWLFNDVAKSLLDINKDKIGISVIADIGFGKSALVYNILCANEVDSAYSIRQHTVAFHVCKFDVPSTHKPERFIRRLVGFLSIKSPEFGNIISMLDNSSIIYDKEQCASELEACFDQGLSIPLHQLTDHKEPWVIIVDALDECFDKDNKKNAILELLSSRMRKLPKWIRVFLTSRNIPQVFQLKKIQPYYANATDTRNYKDIKEFVGKYVSNVTSIDNLKPNLKAETIDRFVNLSEGNFMFITHVLHYLAQRNSSSFSYVTLPSTLNEIYEINFERQFPTPESFRVTKTILEIIIVSLNPLNKDELFKIIKFSNNCSEREFNVSINKLSHFLSFKNDITFVHRSIYEWLKSRSSDLFKVSLKNGHEMISKFLLNSTGSSSKYDPVLLAIHVGQSNGQFLKKKIHLLIQTKQIQFVASDVHKLISSTNSVTALKFILKYRNDVNALNDRRISPAFVAVYKGHLEQLKYLFEHGADIGFTVSRCFFQMTDLFKTLEAVKSDYLCGYGLLHIAANFNQIEIAEFLLKQNETLAYIKNSIGLRASDIACEHGHVKILELISRYDRHVIDVVCLYHAAKNDHVDIVEMILMSDAQLTCCSESESRIVFEQMHHISKTNSGTISSLDNVTINSFDEWWKVVQETPLHVAIRMGSILSAKLIIQNHPELLECSDAFGRTPFLSSIIFNTHEMFIELLDKRKHDVCGNDSQHIHESKNLKIFETEQYDNFCPKGATMAHLIAFYDRQYMLTVVHVKRLVVDWSKRDITSYSPLHYASCQSSFYFLHYIKKHFPSIIQDKATTGNGHTILHLAILCRKFLFLRVLTNSFPENIPNIIDNNGMGYLHHCVMVKSDFGRDSGQTDTFKNLQNRYHFNLIGTDELGRNVLHYILKNGLIDIMIFLNTTRNDDFNQMLNQKDKNGLTPIRYALNTIDSQINGLSWSSCNFLDFVNGKCSAQGVDETLVTDVFESSLIKLFKDKTQFHNIFLENFDKIIVCCPYLTHAVLKKANVTYRIHLQSQLSKSFKYFPRPSLYSLIAIAEYAPSIIKVCNRSFEKSPMHSMAFYNEFHNSVFDLPYIFNQSYNFYEKVFGSPVRVKRISCPDSNGLNMLHYALLGGNICAAHVLMQLGIKPTNDKIKAVDVIFMALYSKIRFYPNDFKCQKYGHICQDTHCQQKFTVDEFISDFISSNLSLFTRKDFCRGGTKRLSIVHILAANEMINSLETVKKYFGFRVLNCQNNHRFTPMFFALLFKMDHIACVLKNNRAYTHQCPNKFAVKTLFAKMLFNIDPPKSGTVSEFCLIAHNSKHFLTNSYLRRKLFLCIQANNLKNKYSDNVSSNNKSLYFRAKFYYNLLQLTHNLLFDKPDQNIPNILERMGHHFKSRFLTVDKSTISKLFKMYKSLPFVYSKNLRLFRFYLTSMFTILLDKMRLILIHQYISGTRPSLLFPVYTSKCMTIPDSYDDIIASTTMLLGKSTNFGAEQYRYLDVIKDTIEYKRLKYVHEDFDENIEYIRCKSPPLQNPLHNLETVKFRSQSKESYKETILRQSIVTRYKVTVDITYK